MLVALSRMCVLSSSLSRALPPKFQCFGIGKGQHLDTKIRHVGSSPRAMLVLVVVLVSDSSGSGLMF